VSQDKRSVRAAVRRQLGSLDPAGRAAAGQAATRWLLSLPEVAEAQVMAAYSALPDELDPAEAVRSLLVRGARVLLPRVRGDLLELVPVTAVDDLAPGFRGVLEPTGVAADVSDLDVIVVPGVAFDRAGRRLGRGGGHYDRLLARVPEATVRIGLCFSSQVVEELPEEAHDQRVDVVVTEAGIERGWGPVG
jgi:5-formyltetrahydrofolate cyclo-ligase